MTRIKAHGGGGNTTDNDLPPHAQFLCTSNNDHSSVENTDKLLGMKVKFPHKGETREGCITNCKRNSDGILIGTENNNTIHDTQEYKIDIGDEDYSDYTANTII